MSAIQPKMLIIKMSALGDLFMALPHIVCGKAVYCGDLIEVLIA